MNRKLGMAFIALVMMATSPSKMNAQSCAQHTNTISENLRFNESTYPYKDGLLIANFGTEQLNPLNSEGKGYIVYSKEGKNSVLIPSDGFLSAPKGMFVRNGHLFVCDVNKVVVYNLDNPSLKPYIINMPEGNLFVNDLVASGNNLYVSVTNTDKIYRIDISDLSHIGAPVEWVKVAGPNGLLIEKEVMYIASYPADGKTTDKNVIYRIADLDRPRPERFITVPGQYDGIALSTNKEALYITNWSPAQISKVDLKSKRMTPLNLSLKQDLVGPADISTANGMLYIPDLPNSRVVIVKEDDFLD
ncbi:MAG: hypothetical protein RR137_10515 [Odoribacter sp.]